MNTQDITPEVLAAIRERIHVQYSREKAHLHSVDWDHDPDNRVLSDKELCAALSVTAQATRRWRLKDENPLPSWRLPTGAIRYTLGEVRGWLKANEPGPEKHQRNDLTRKAG